MKHSGISIDKLSPRYQEQVGAVLHASPHAKPSSRGDLTPVPASGRPKATPPAKGQGSAAYPLSIWLDYIVPSLNRILRKHWSTLGREKKDAQDCLLEALAVMPRRAPATGRIHLLVTLYRVRLIDPDNAFPKPLIDCMRAARLLVDDDPSCLDLTIRQVRVSKRKLEGTKLTLVEALP